MGNRFDPPEVWAPFGAFSMGALQGEGQVVHLKGQVSLDRSGEIVGPHDMEAQLQQTLENIQAVLGHVGGEMGDILSMTHYVTDIEAFMKLGVLRKRFIPAPYPVTTTIEVSRLYDPAIVVEITVIAEIPRDRFKPPAG